MSTPSPSSQFEELRAYTVIVSLALITIYTGSYASLRMPKSVRQKLKKVSKELDGDEDEDEQEDEAEDAYLFPVLGSVVLFGLYLAFLYGDKALINKVLGGYLALMGVGALAKTLVTVCRRVMGKKTWNGLTKWKLSLTRNKEDYASHSFNAVHVTCLALGLALQALQLYKPFWVASNLVALSFAFGAIGLMRLDSFWTGSALLALLFFYDIWWVFGSKHFFNADVMVKVATSFDAPIKITFPRIFENLLLLKGKDFVLLGLGDIVLPGIFVALALRYDYHRAIKKDPPPSPEGKYGKPYFHATCFAYALGLITTIVVMHCFKAAQPALLYLSPACILAICFTAVRRGEWNHLWKFDDASDDEKKDKSDKGVKGDEKEERIDEEGDSTGVEKRVLRNRTVEVGNESSSKERL